MPYNTRRKSLSLPSLGIQLPNSSRSAAHRSPPAMPAVAEEHLPPSKKIKRSHTTSSASPRPQSPVAASLKHRNDRPRSAGRVAEHTPPPSPGETGSFSVDTDGINDDVVVSVIEQLQKTGNRPHQLKELAAVLSNQLPIVESSANPPAIISARLTNYCRRSWSALAPCPIGKELVGTHPKRLYFFLTQIPHQPFPETDDLPSNSKRIISPSLSSAADEEEARDLAARRAFSPSPEVDLSSPELEDDSAPDTPGAPFSGRSSVSGDGHPPTLTNISHNRRAVSPPLERDEREFTVMATSLQQRQRSKSLEEPDVKPVEMPDSATPDMEDGIPEVVEESEESAAIRNSEAAAALFGHQDNHLHATAFIDLQSSPMLKPHLEIKTELPVNPGPLTGLSNELKDVSMADKDVVDDIAWAELDRPEDIGLDELDKWFE